MRTKIALAAFVLALAADGAAQEADPLGSVADADPVELARVAHRIGDRAVVSRLGPERSVVVRLAAIRATPAMRSPEAALVPLADIARGRDPLLAPAAALAALRIAEALTPDDLAAREVLRAEIDAAVAALAALAADETARADIRRAATLATAAVTGLIR